MNGKLGQCLSVERDLFVLKSFDERRVAESVRGKRCIEANDPELAESALLGLAVAVRITAGLHHGLIGFDEGLRAHAAVALGKLADLLMTPMADDTALNSHDAKEWMGDESWRA